MFVTYTTSSKIGNIGVMYNNLTEVARLNPVAGNRGGSYLTFWSIAGLKFGVLQTVSCWGKPHRKEKKYYTFRHQINDTPSIIPGCPV